MVKTPPNELDQPEQIENGATEQAEQIADGQQQALPE